MGTAVSLVGGTLAIMVAWDRLDLPVPATMHDVDSAVGGHEVSTDARFQMVEDDARQNKVLTLALTRGNLESQLDRIDAQLNVDPGNSELKRRRRETQRQIDGVTRQIDKLSQ